MTSSTKEGTEMKRRKRFTIKMVALGFAVTAIAAAPAQASLDEGLGLSKQSEPTLAVSPDDRAVNLMSPQTPSTVVSPDDRAVNLMSPQSTPVTGVSPDDRAVPRVSPLTPIQPTTISSDDGFEIGNLGLMGIALVVAAGLGFAAIYQGRRGKLASA